MLIILGPFCKHLGKSNFMPIWKNALLELTRLFSWVLLCLQRVFILMIIKLKQLKLGHNPPICNKCSFLGLAGFYRRFVKDFSAIASPLHALSKKNAPFVWGHSQSTAFEELKSLLTHA